jgi:hypothetical protein
LANPTAEIKDKGGYKGEGAGGSGADNLNDQKIPETREKESQDGF